MIEGLMETIRNRFKNKSKNAFEPLCIVCLPFVCISNYFQQQQFSALLLFLWLASLASRGAVAS